MTERESLVPLLRELDQELGREQMPAAAQHRIAAALRERTRQGGHTRNWLPMITFACGAALVLLVVALGAWAPSAPAQPETVAARPTLGAFVVEGQRCRTESAEEGRHRLLGHCRLIGNHMTISSWKEAVVTQRAGTVDVVSGRVLFDVDPVRPGEGSITVGVSSGIIEVVGTRFEVNEGPTGGHVDLFEGKIRFHDRDGTTADIAPGTRHSWGDQRETVVILDETDEADVVVATAQETPAPVHHARARPQPRRGAHEAAEIIERVDRLRRSGRTSQGVALLRRAVHDRWDSRTAQVLSYELGELLHRYVGDREEACRHFDDHQRRFPRGRYHRAVERTLERLGCESSVQPP